MKTKKYRRLELKTFLFLILFLFLLLPLFSFAQEKGEIKQVIFDKEYRVEKGTKEGKEGYWCYWGEDKAWWEPKPWYLKELNEQGPILYQRWTKPGLVWPWDATLEEREKWTGYDWALRGPNLASGLQHMIGYCDIGQGILISPEGRERAKRYLEYNIAFVKRQYGGHLPQEEGKLLRKYAFVYTTPEDIKGLGMVMISYSGKKEDDNWFYSPSVRKVRRMSTGARQDFFPGTCHRNEDIYITKPIHEYKIVRTELFKDPGSEVYGFGSSKRELDPGCIRMDGIGSPCVVVEVTLPKGWYCDKQIRWYNILTGGFCNYELSYDKKGRLIRTFAPHMTLHHPEKYPIDVTWSTWCVHDLLTGYKSIFPVPDEDFHENVDVPESTFTESFLLKEASVLFWWR